MSKGRTGELTNLRMLNFDRVQSNLKKKKRKIDWWDSEAESFSLWTVADWRHDGFVSSMKSSPSFEVPPFFRRSHHPRLTVLISFRIFHVSQHLRIEYVQCTHACTQQYKLHVLIIVKQKRSKNKAKRTKNEKKTEEKIHSVRINVYLSSANWTNLAIRKRILYHETVPNIYLLYI